MNNELLSSNQRTTTLQNILFLDEFNHIADACTVAGINLVALKGISLIGRIYDASERSMTDIDVLITPEELASLKKILLERGFLERFEEKWSANDFKFIFYKFHMGLEIVLEVHTQLIADQKRDHWHFIKHKNYKILAPQDEILYLAYHYAHQHTLLKAKWLHDIYLLSIASHGLWNKSLWTRAKDKGIFSALLFTTHALNRKYYLKLSYPYSLKNRIAKPLLNLEFIENPDHFAYKYYVTKHIVKDSLTQAIAYDIQWLYFTIKKRFAKKSQ